MGNQPEAVDQQEAGAANHKRRNSGSNRLYRRASDGREDGFREYSLHLSLFQIPSAPDVCICGRLSPAHLSYEAQAD